MSPAITYPPDLPIVARRDDIMAAIREHQVVVICGDTGSGKSTQLPKMCLDLGRGGDALIGHTQPRRLAARTLAARIAEELQSSVGGVVGFKHRFTDTTSPDTRIKLMTDGILLAEMQRDRELRAYDTLIIDEAHERSLNIDFLLGVLHRLLPRRADMKVIVTSATINPQQFAEFFAGAGGEAAPIIEVSGRTYPVEVRYLEERHEGTEAMRHEAEKDGTGPALSARGAERSASSTDAAERELHMPTAIVDALEEVFREGPGDALVFLPTERDILETAKVLRGAGGLRNVEVLPLYARLSPREQSRVFERHPGRRVVLSTNVAETSLTVPGVRYVVDTGLARVGRYSPRAGVQRLPVEPISRASADQRKGRCGREGPGICIRLYPEEDYQTREAFTPPEVLRSNLAGVMLQMRGMRLGEVADFPFLEPPRSAAVRDGQATLHELGALDRDGVLTDIGRKLIRLPADPRIARMVLAAQAEGCVADVLPIAAALTAGDPRLRPVGREAAADEAHAIFLDERSDFLTLLRLWDFVHDLSRRLSRGKLHKALGGRFLSHRRVREWQDVHRQLRESLGAAGVRVRERRWVAGSRKGSGTFSPPNDAATRDGTGGEKVPDPLTPPATAPDAIHRSLLAGLLSRVAMRTDTFVYTGTGGKRLYLWPGSVAFDAKPQWIAAAELVETSRAYARTLAPIDPAWVEPLAEHLVSRSYSEPHWQPTSGHVGAFERVSLGGLTLVPKRRVHFGPIDPPQARSMFIQNALVEGDVRWPRGEPAFAKHNRELAERIAALEARARRRDLLAEATARYGFFDRVLPADVYSVPAFEKWRRRAERHDPELLHMGEADLLRTDASHVTPAAYPDGFEAARGVVLPLEYANEPGAKHDGVTLRVPVEAADQLDPARLGWLVPGLLPEKVTAMIRSLPKPLRRNFVPAPQWADRIIESLTDGRGTLEEAVAAAMGRLSGVRVTPSDFDLSQLPDHLRMNVRVVDAAGEVLAEARSLGEVRAAVGGRAAEALAEATQGQGEGAWHRDGLTRWDFGELPESVELERAGVQLRAFPALVDQGDAAGLRLLESPDAARRTHRGGVRRLLALSLAKPLAHQIKTMPDLQAMTLHAATLMPADVLRRELSTLIVDRACLGDDDASTLRDGLAFADRLEHGWGRLSEAATAAGRLVTSILREHHAARLAIDAACEQPALTQAVGDVRWQLQTLMPEGFLTATPWPWLMQFPRYLKAARLRLERLTASTPSTVPPARDADALRQLAPHLRRLLGRQREHAARRVVDPALEDYLWMIEELRVSLFAQELGTAVKVSPQRLDRQWDKVRA